MATVYATQDFRMDNFSFNYLDDDRTGLGVPANVTSPLGNVYANTLRIDFAGDDTGSAFFGGFGFTFAAGPTVTGGTVTGFFQTLVDGANTVTDFGIEGFSVSAVAVYDAVLTEGKADDVAIIQSILGGDDSFDLSPVADFALGYAGNDLMQGNGGNDTLLGGDGTDVLEGGGGGDRLTGGAGRDTLTGGQGNDIYVVGAGDTVTESRGQGSDLVISSIAWTLAANVENLTQAGGGNIRGAGNILGNTILGNGGNNSLVGLGGKDVLSGGGGNDTLSGGLGSDTLTGGVGADAFLFNAPLNALTNTDLVIDFSSGDVVRLDDDVFRALTVEFPGLDATQFLAGAGADAALDDSDRIIYNTTTGELFYDADGSGSMAAAIRFAILGTGTHPALTAADFVIVG